jgi:hypothetical protein
MTKINEKHAGVGPRKKRENKINKFEGDIA